MAGETHCACLASEGSLKPGRPIAKHRPPGRGPDTPVNSSSQPQLTAGKQPRPRLLAPAARRLLSLRRPEGRRGRWNQGSSKAPLPRRGPHYLVETTHGFLWNHNRNYPLTVQDIKKSRRPFEKCWQSTRWSTLSCPCPHPHQAYSAGRLQVTSREGKKPLGGFNFSCSVPDRQD